MNNAIDSVVKCHCTAGNLFCLSFKISGWCNLYKLDVDRKNIPPMLTHKFENLDISSVCGSNQKPPVKNLSVFRGGLLHDLGERLNGIQEVDGSIPLVSTKVVETDVSTTFFTFLIEATILHLFDSLLSQFEGVIPSVQWID